VYVVVECISIDLDMEIDLTQKTDLVLRRCREAPRSSCQFVLGEHFQVGDFDVPVGFDTDLASVPIGARNLISRLDGIEAAVLHDWLYRTGNVKRKKADEIFFVLLEGAVPTWKRYAMYWAVRVGGKGSYKG